MSTTSAIFKGKTVRKIFNFTTRDTLIELEKHIKYHLFNPDHFVIAKIDYDASEGLPTESILHNPDYYPLKFITENGREELWLSCVTAGYAGEGPHGTVEALRMMGFDVPTTREEEIFTVKDAHFEYLK